MGVKLEGCAITYPANAEYDMYQSAVCVNGYYHQGRVVISRTEANAIRSVTAFSSAVSSIYSLEGIILREMGKGINIVRMAAGSIKKVVCSGR